jgi:hypothetical protein
MNSRFCFATSVAVVVFLGMMAREAVRGATVTIGWSASAGSSVAGYHVYFGGVSQDYTNMIDAGRATNGTVTGLSAGRTYYFSVTAYDVTGLESLFSSEISYAIPASTNSVPPTNSAPVAKGHNKAKLRLSLNASRQPTITATAPVAYRYNVQASTDLKTWTTIGRVTVGLPGEVSFTDKKAKNNTRQYYRLEETGP